MPSFATRTHGLLKIQRLPNKEERGIYHSATGHRKDSIFWVFDRSGNRTDLQVLLSYLTAPAYKRSLRRRSWNPHGCFIIHGYLRSGHSHLVLSSTPPSPPPSTDIRWASRQSTTQGDRNSSASCNFRAHIPVPRRPSNRSSLVSLRLQTTRAGITPRIGNNEQLPGMCLATGDY